MPETLGTFEQAVLPAIVRLRDDACGRAILREVQERLEREFVAGAVHATLERLEGKGLIRSSLGPGTPMNRRGFPNFTAYSAGSHPGGTVNPAALKQIADAGLPTEGLRSKSWNEFENPDAPEMPLIFTVCDNAAAEVCPVWPGQPLSGRWGVPAPAAVTGTEAQIERAFSEAYMVLDRRMTLFLCLPLATLEHDIIEREINRIGRS